MNTLLTMHDAAPCEESEGVPAGAMGYGQRLEALDYIPDLLELLSRFAAQGW